jgi:uncharacterized protein
MTQKKGEAYMLFSVHALDKPGSETTRQKVHAEHVAHLKTAAAHGVTMVMGGPLVSDDGKDAVGSLMVFEANDRSGVENFNRNDPFFKNGVWAKVEIQRFEKRTG